MDVIFDWNSGNMTYNGLITHQRSFWMHLMELLGDVGHVESHFGLFGDSVRIGAI